MPALALKICRWPALAMLCSLALVGCGESMSPAAPATNLKDIRPYYPLAVGNHWVYCLRTTYTEDSLGTVTTRVFPALLEVEMQSEGAVSLGRTYVREASRVGVGGQTPRGDWHINLVRQDSKGLYEMVPAAYLAELPRPAADSTDGPGFDATRLGFPLRVGAEWESPNYGHFRAEGLEDIHVPAGHFTRCVEITEEGGEAGLHVRTVYCPDVGPAIVESRQELTLAMSGGVTVTGSLRGFQQGDDDEF